MALGKCADTDIIIDSHDLFEEIDIFVKHLWNISFTTSMFICKMSTEKDELLMMQYKHGMLLSETTGRRGETQNKYDFAESLDGWI